MTSALIRFMRSKSIHLCGVLALLAFAACVIDEPIEGEHALDLADADGQPVIEEGSLDNVLRRPVDDTEIRSKLGLASQVSLPDAVMASSANEWFCYGESYHTVQPDGSVIWTFRTQNNSTRNKRQAPVTGKVFHPSSGNVLTCNKGDYNNGNTCTIATPSGSGYTSAIGEHFCCEKRSFSYVCTNTFYTSDSL